MGLGLFGFMDMADNYEERKVASHNKEGLFVDTVSVSDSTKPFETAVAHPKYNDGDIIIVELYDTREEAQIGHDKWLETMLTNPPQQLVDVSSCTSAEMLRSLDGLPAFERAGE